MRIPGLAVAVATVALASVPSVASPDPQGTLSEAIEAYVATLPPAPAIAFAIANPIPRDPPVTMARTWSPLSESLY